MKQIAALIVEEYAGLVAELEATAAALQPHGIALQLIDYTKLGAPLPKADAYLLQGISGYYSDYEGFLTFLDLLRQSGKPCLNEPDLVRWNSDKHYLKELEAEGISCIPTLWADSPTPELLAQARDQGWEKIVVKPTISAGAYQTIRLSTQDTAPWSDYCTQAGKCAVMLQPFAPEIVDEGEWSFVFFLGEFSHCLLKTAKAGDYRIQHVHGGKYTPQIPPRELLEDAENILRKLPAKAVYARVDGIRRNGHLVLMEVELIEPFLYMLPDTEAIARFADALKSAV